MKKWVILGAVVLAAAVAWSFRPKSIDVETVTVTRGALEATLEQEGRTRVGDRYPILSPLDGTVRRVTLEAGDPVVAGETVIAVIDPPPARLLDPRTAEEAMARIGAAEGGVAEAAARIEQVEEQRRLAELEYVRLRDLVASGDAPISQRDQAERGLRGLEGDARRAVAALAIAEHDLIGARAAFARHTVSAGEDGAESVETGPLEIRAPIDGRVLRVMRESAGPIAAGAAIVELGDLRDLEIVADYLTTDAVQIESGMPARIDGWGGETLAATVRRVEPSGVTKVSALGVEEQRVDVVLDLDGGAAAAGGSATALGDGYRVEVRVITWRGEGVLLVPEGALFRAEDGKWALFRTDGGRAIETKVRIGHRDGLLAEVLEGVREGEAVIVHPPDAVQDEVRVRRLDR